MISVSQVELWLDNMTRYLQRQLEQSDPQQTVLIGIHSGGVRIAAELQRRLKLPHATGTLDISFYRDDFSRLGLHPEVKPSNLPFEVENKTVILVDDVLYSGRTVRAALNEIFDYGRPARVLLAVLVEREGQELPIRANVYGSRLALREGQQVKLNADDLGLTLQERSA